MKYYIEKNESVDKYGEVMNQWYTVKWLVPRFFGLFSVWKYQRNPYYESYERTTFGSRKLAQRFIENVLCNGRPTSTTTKSVVDVVSECK